MVSKNNRAPSPVILDVRVVVGAGGGPEKTILNSPRFLQPAGYRNLCAYMRDPGDAAFEALRARASRYHAPLLEVCDRGPWDWRPFTELLSICRQERVAIWHGHDYKSNLLGLLLKRFWPRMSLVTTLHGWVDHSGRAPLYYAVDRWCLPYYQHVICVSADLAENAVRCGVPPERCTLIENGIDTDEYAPRLPASAARELMGISPARTILGAVGRLSPEKGYDVLIRAADQMIAAGNDIELWIIGAGPQRDTLQALIDSLGRQNRIRLLGYRENILSLYQAMDLFVLSSLREGLPNVVLEAMALEVPVVATRIAGVPRLIEDGQNGLLVEPGDVRALADAIGRILDNPGLGQRLAAAGRRTIEERYSFAVRMAKVEAIYDRLLGRTREAADIGTGAVCEGAL